MDHEAVELFFDYLSPYAYFAALELPAICERRGVALRYRPILLAGLLDHHGQRGPAEIPAKALYVLRDCARYARRHGIAFRAPQFHPFRSLTALRVSLELVAGGAQARVIDALYRAGWGDGIDLGSSDEIAAALNRAGLDGPGLVARTSEPDVKQTLKDETARAISLGVFGVPTMIVGSELFWGKDRLSDVDAFLGGDDPLRGVDLSEIAPRGPSAIRPAARRV